MYIIYKYKEDLALNNEQWLTCHNHTEPNHIYLVYIHKQDVALNNLQLLVCHKTKPNPTKPNYIYIYIYIYIYKEDLAVNNQQWLICHKTQRYQINFSCKAIMLHTNLFTPFTQAGIDTRSIILSEL